jgi:hypothetical protein
MSYFRNRTGGLMVSLSASTAVDCRLEWRKQQTMFLILLLFLFYSNLNSISFYFSVVIFFQSDSKFLLFTLKPFLRIVFITWTLLLCHVYGKPIAISATLLVPAVLLLLKRVDKSQKRKEWRNYVCVPVNQVLMSTIKLSKWWKIIVMLSICRYCWNVAACKKKRNNVKMSM